MLMLSFGFRSGFGLFVPPISEANGWSREVMSLCLAIQNLVWGIIAVFAGGLADRFGTRRVLVSGALLYSAGMWLMAGADTPWLLYGSGGVLVGAGVAGTAFGIVLPAMARAVDISRRQWVLGLGTAAGSLGQFLVVPVVQQLISAFGWILALQILALVALAMVALAIPLLSGATAGPVTHEHEVEMDLKQVLALALRTPSFLLLVAGFYVCGFQLAFVTAHMPAFLQDNGFDAQVGAWCIAIIGLCNVAGAYLSGILSGRYPKRDVLMTIYAVRAASLVVFMLVPISLASVLVFSVVTGFFWLATIPPTSGMVATLFGTRYMSLLYGIVFLGHQLGSFCAVYFGGVIYERTGSYDIVWWLAAGLALMAAFVHWPIREARVMRAPQPGSVIQAT
ncbi:MFS transporter [Marinobacterium zhoushanense]|uniref:MFS transporter n=2 Tax=Marinobacterium zhoushanense TaxID=1679163 RepID=A0ABQ1KV51_9GAMM|nr:MFS transporter [Marinobacterium zhoushanense]